MELFKDISTQEMAAAEVAEDGENPSKRRGLLGKDQQKLEEIVKTSVKLNLYCSQQIRTLRAITIWCIKMATEDAFIVAAKAATKKYDDVAKTLKGKQTSEE
eukprot:388319-Karenia_brevis.AAC.1